MLICYIAYMADIAEYRPIPPILQAIRRRLGQEQFTEVFGVPFATASRWVGGVTTPQRAARVVIAPFAAEEFGDSRR